MARFLKLQSGLAGRLGEGFHPAVIEVSVAVENDLRDLLLEANLRDQSSNLLGGIHLPVIAEGALQVARERRGRGERLTVHVVYHLGVDVPAAAEDAEAGALGNSRDLRTNPELSALPTGQ